MRIKHIDPYGNELGLYRSIKEASIRTGHSIDLLYTVVKHKLALYDGTKLYKAIEPSDKRREREANIQRMITEHIKLETHPRFLAKKYELQLSEVMRLLTRRANEEKLNSAYSEWLTTGETVKAIAERHDVSLNTLSGRINRGLLTKERV
jgi:hypothetical protein